MWLYNLFLPQFCKSDMSWYGYLKVFQRVPCSLRYSKFTVQYMVISKFYFISRHVANGEILGVALLMDDVLQTGFQDISLLTEHTTGEGDKKGDKKEKKPRAGSAVEKVERRKSTSSALGKILFFRDLDIYLSKKQSGNVSKGTLLCPPTYSKGDILILVQILLALALLVLALALAWTSGWILTNFHGLGHNKDLINHIYLSVVTPYLLAIRVLKFEQVHFTICWCV